MKKIILWSVAGIFVVGIVAAGIWWLGRQPVIQLDKNTTLTLLGTEYGKHHKFPPVKTKNGRQSGGGQSFDTTNDTLVVWILQESKGNQRYGWQAMVYDRDETASVQNWASRWDQAGPNRQIGAIQVGAFPRRDSKFFLRFMTWGNGGQHISKEQFVISNPNRWKMFSKWTPDALPDTQSDGDLTVTLNKLALAASPWGRSGASKNDPANRVVQFDVGVQQKGLAVTNWRPVQAETSDATGNDITGWVNDNRSAGQSTGYFYQPILWPNEPAWKVRLEFSRTSGFNDDELWSVTNIPVRAGSQQDSWNYRISRSGRTNAPFAETTINGVNVKLFPSLQYTSQYGNGGKVVGLSLQTEPDAGSAGMRITPLEVTDDQGHRLSGQGSSWGGGSYQYEFTEPRKPDSINVTIALHKSRFVEFAVKPTKQ